MARQSRKTRTRTRGRQSHSPGAQPDIATARQSPQFFVGHAFSTAKIADLRRAVTNVFRGSGFEACYADRDVTDSHILKKMHGMIQGAEFGLFDISGSNPNVYLELGLAYASQKPWYIVAEANTKPAADLVGLDRIEYTSYADLEAKLERYVLRNELRRAEDVRRERAHRYRSYDIQDVETILRSAVVTYAAASLPMHHRFGREVADGGAVFSTAWEADLFGTQSHLMYGPYQRLPKRGRYVVIFRIKCNHNSFSADPLLTLDVVGSAAAGRHVYAAEWEKASNYRCFGVDFGYERLGDLEYRIYNMTRQGTVRVDFVAVLALRGDRRAETLVLRGR